jgi:hypothetical protein
MGGVVGHGVFSVVSATMDWEARRLIFKINILKFIFVVEIE